MSIYLRLTTYTTITKEWLYQKYVTHASQAIYKRYPTENFFTKKKKKKSLHNGYKTGHIIAFTNKKPISLFYFYFSKKQSISKHYNLFNFLSQINFFFSNFPYKFFLLYITSITFCY
jgi:hypothetical protein